MVRVVVGFDFPQGLDARHVGHVPVHEDQLEAAGGEFSQRIGAVAASVTSVRPSFSSVFFSMRRMVFESSTRRIFMVRFLFGWIGSYLALESNDQMEGSQRGFEGDGQGDCALATLDFMVLPEDDSRQ